MMTIYGYNTIYFLISDFLANYTRIPSIETKSPYSMAAIGETHVSQAGGMVSENDNSTATPGGRLPFQQNPSPHRGVRAHPKGKNFTRKNTPATLPTVNKINGMYF